MGRKVDTEVIEALDELNTLLKSTNNYRSRQKIKSLIYTKNNKYGTRQSLADYLEISVRTLFDWMKLYKADGLKLFIQSTSGGANNVVIPESVKVGIKKKLNNSTEPLQGYKDAVQWVKKTYSIDVKYQTLRSYMIHNFGTKLKQPRKSHYKKDEKAFDAFKKTSPRS